MPLAWPTAGPMTRPERRAVGVLAAIFAIRMLGLFMLLPVLALYGKSLPGATPLLIGLAVGAYGITQALLQIPFGMLSDRLGRKPVILTGLAVFAAGSVLAALGENIATVIAGRALQGAGAVSAAVTALLADLTREAVRTRAMAIVGVSIGASFAGSLILGPVLSTEIGVGGLFWLTAALAVAAMALLLTAVPAPHGHPSPASMSGGGFRAVLLDHRLLGLNLGAFALHLILTASFVAVPFVLRDMLGVPSASHWQIYLGVLAASLGGTIPLILLAERCARPQFVAGFAIAAIAVAQAALLLFHSSLWPAVAALALFFAGFNFLEARLPAELSRRAPAQHRGAALGVYASAQFLGAFAGGVLGGSLLGLAGLGGVFLLGALVAAAWLGFTHVRRQGALVSP